ncbi:ROK family glucokinase [Paenibacillus doosanensis]|uniref:ROK family glucokinase n=1 Tax=Paenibacillus doosanensis TaxID=1229154 RepID=UPI0021805CFB|nr:ROK family glucokinase [Paenibacillus doosanensis]MCS7458621.1 ROK family glucokinase [Paenibacillus doosanensis]
MKKALYAGIDIGGTNVKVGLCDADGRLLHKLEGPTGGAEGLHEAVRRIDQYVRRAVDEAGGHWSDVAGIGAGIPGFVDIHSGVVALAENLGWEQVPIARILSEQFGKPVAIENDANLAALGEALRGAGRGVNHLVCYTVGTGVGGGIVEAGRLVHGFGGMAGELGHLRIAAEAEAAPCNCGLRGCLETIASATGIVRLAREAIERGEGTTLAGLDLARLEAKDVFVHAEAGDGAAVRIVRKAADALGLSMAMAAAVTNPQRFIIGGGVSRAGETLLAPVREAFARYAAEPLRRQVDIVQAQLGNDAGIIGAAGLGRGLSCFRS